MRFKLSFQVNYDCRYYLGDNPCRFKRVCNKCSEYSPMGFRILIIKLGAAGDVIRTTTILPSLKSTYPVSHITWITDSVIYPLIKNIKLVDRCLSFSNPDTYWTLINEDFDLLICLDKEPRATGLSMQVNSTKKMGFGLDKKGSLIILNPEMDYALQLGLDDFLKFKINTKTYQEIIFEGLCLPYNRQEYCLDCSEYCHEKSRYWAEKFTTQDKLVIGLNTGSGARFLTKRWPVEYYMSLIDLIHKNMGDVVKILLLGGPEEQANNQAIYDSASERGLPVIYTGCEHSITDFYSIMNLCDLVVTSDTLAMHLAIALKKKVIALIGSTSASEIDLYDRGIKLIVDSREFPCSPCYRGTCNQPVFCMTRITPQIVHNMIMKLIGK